MMKIKMLKSALAGLVLSISGFANAGLILEIERHSDTSATFNASGVLDVAVPSGDIRVGIDNIFSVVPGGGRNDRVSSYDGSLSLGTGFYSSMYTLANWTASSPNGLYWFSVFPSLGDTFSGSFKIDLPTGYAFSSFDTTGNITFAIFDSGTVDNRTFIGTWSFSNDNPTQVPEPSTLAIFTLTFLGLVSRKFSNEQQKLG